MLAHLGRVKVDSLSHAWQEKALAVERVELVGLTSTMAVRAATLQVSRGGDPVDWLIVATAQELQVPLVTRDERIAESELVETIW